MLCTQLKLELDHYGDEVRRGRCGVQQGRSLERFPPNLAVLAIDHRTKSGSLLLYFRSIPLAAYYALFSLQGPQSTLLYSKSIARILSYYLTMPPDPNNYVFADVCSSL
jgi:hypothetical protein